MKSRMMPLILLALFVCSIIPVSAGGGGASVRVSTVDLTEQMDNYNTHLGRLKFEFNEKGYAIQVMRVKDEYASFIILDLDENKLEDITANDGVKDSKSVESNYLRIV